MAGEKGEGSGDDLNVLDLQVTLRVSFFGAHPSNELHVRTQCCISAEAQLHRR